MAYIVVDNTLILDREVTIKELIARDGPGCRYPKQDGTLCTRSFHEPKHGLTIDHIYPRALARKEGWTEEQIWDLSNLQLMGEVCNSRKSDRLYGPDGLLLNEYTPRPVRLDLCNHCMSGRLLLYGETCEVCGIGPRPSKFPRYNQRTPKECDHKTTHCWLCVIG